MLKLQKGFRILASFSNFKLEFLAIGNCPTIMRNQKFYFSDTKANKSGINNEQSNEELFAFFQSKLISPPNLECFNESIQDLKSIYMQGFLTQDQTTDLFRQCLQYFSLILKENFIFQNELLFQSSELVTDLLKSIIENLDVEILLLSLKSWKKLDPKYSKSYWNFIEFLLTRTKFMNLFKGKQIVDLLNSYFEIRNKYEMDKFSYIFDKCDHYICTKEDLQFEKEDIARILYLYIKCNLGSDRFFDKLFRQFVLERDKLSLSDLVTCNWCFVNYNLTKQDKNLLVFQKDVYEKISNNIKELNSYQIKQFLWAYQMEKLMLR